MNYERMLLMFGITFFVPSETMIIILNNVTNLDLVSNVVINNNLFSKLGGTNGIICALTNDEKGNIYAANNEGIIYKSECSNGNNKEFEQVFKVENAETIQLLATGTNGNVYTVIKSAANGIKIYQKKNNSEQFKLLTRLTVNLLSMAVYSDNDDEDVLYLGTDKNVQVFYPSWGMLEIIDGTTGQISSIIKDNKHDKCIYAGTSDGKIYKTIGGDQRFEEVAVTDSTISDLTIDNGNNVYATNWVGQVWKKSNVNSNFTKFQTKLSNALKAIVTDNNNNIYVGDNIGNIWKSDGQSVFSQLQTIEGDITKLIFSVSTNRIYVGSSDGVYFSN